MIVTLRGGKVKIFSGYRGYGLAEKKAYPLCNIKTFDIFLDKQ
jgi:hypothetical protein